MAEVDIGDQSIQPFLVKVSLDQLMMITESNSRPLTKLERWACTVQKNKILNLPLLKKQWENNANYNRLINKLNRAKPIKFVTTEPRSFHPYLVVEFYQRSIIAPDKQYFATEVYNTQFDIPPHSTAEEFGVDNV